MNQWIEISEELVQWYKTYARDLPWRRTQNPYYIWISEIMLQQTRVEAVKSYYIRFIKALPTIKDLAEVEEDVLLKLWEGLGYYSRARNLKKAAQMIMLSYDGQVPTAYSELLKLNGVGPYTAGAIASIAFGLPYPAVDGNVLRVMSRLTADKRDIALEVTKKQWTKDLTEFMPKMESGKLNQGLMELGATVCIPNGVPKCEICPLRTYCLGYEKGIAQSLPIKSPKKKRVSENLSVFFIVNNNKIVIEKRNTQGLLSKLWQLPNCKEEIAIPLMLHEWGIGQANIIQMTTQKHIFTHVQWHMECYYIECRNIECTNIKNTEFVWVEKETLENEYALPSAFKKIWIEGCQMLKERK